MKHLFLDLEKTWIESVDNQVFLNHNIEKIVKKFKSEQFDSVTIFSFAIHTLEDVESVRSVIEDISDRIGRFVRIQPKNELLPAFKKFFNIPTMDLIDFHDFCNSKELGFQIFIKEGIKEFSKDELTDIGEEFVLIDDMVDNTILLFNGNRIETINVDNMF
jgi:hypothetical protein